MTLTPRSISVDYMLVGNYMFDAETWVQTRFGWTRISDSGKQITVYDSARPPYTYGQTREANCATASKGDHILHNGKGQFRVLTKAQFDYWYEEV